MARIRDFAITVEAVTTASMVCTMPKHETGDLLVAFVNKDTASNFNTPSGWTAQQTQVSAGAGGGVYTKRATSASETVTFTLSIETCCGVVIAVKDCFGTTEADAVSASAKSSVDDDVLPYTGIGITPLHDDCLILHGLSGDLGYGGNALPPWINLFAGDAAANSLCVSYTQQYGTAAAITAPEHWGGVGSGADNRGFIIAVRPAVSPIPSRNGYIPLATTPARQISPMNGSTGVVDKGTWASSAANTITSVAGRPVTGTAINTTADSGINPYRGSARAAGATSKTNYSSVEINMTATDDLTNLNGLIFLTFMNLTPSDYKDQGTPAQGGKYILFGSDASNYRAWLIGGFNSATEVPDARNNVLIEFATTDTALATLGTPNFAAFDLMQFGAMGYAAASSMLVNELYLLNVVQLAGGTSTESLGLGDLVFVVNNGCGILPLIQRSGVLVTLWIPVKFGGTDPLFFVEDKRVFAFPQKADGITFLNFHVSNNKVGIEFDGQDRGAGDVDILHFTGCLFTSPSSYYWRFASTHDAGADIDFTGSTVINAAVTLRSTVTLAQVKFSSCPSFALNGATITEGVFVDTKVSADSPGDAEKISNSSFEKTAGTQHGLEIGGTAADLTLTDITWTGYAASNGSTGNEAIFFNIGSGTINLTISGGTVPSVRTAGATINVIAGVTLTLTGLLAGSEVRIYAAGTQTELTGIESSGTTFAYTYTFASQSVDIVVFALSRLPIRLTNFALPATDADLPIQQQIDRQYENP